MKTYKPTTPSRRHLTGIDYSVLSRVKPKKSLLKRLVSHAGRNSQGRISVRHQGGGHKKLYRMVDFKQFNVNAPVKVETIEYDPYRTAFIALVAKNDGSRSYILASEGLKAGDEISVSENATLKSGNRLKLKNILVGSPVCNVELTPGKGGQLARSAGVSAQVLAHEDGYTHLKLPSGEIRKVLWDGYATLGQMSNPEHNLITIGKAGRSRWLGIRPTVRGSAMNPVDHPYGGGEGSQPRGTRRPKTLWGKITGGRKTRGKRRQSNRLILQRRAKKSKK